MRDFKGLKAWQEAHQLALAVYKCTGEFPKAELYGLTSQIRRACVSIASNIAEGCGRKSQFELAHYLQVAIGSANELEYQLLLAKDLAFFQDQQHEVLNRRVSEVRQMLTALVRRVRKDAFLERAT